MPIGSVAYDLVVLIIPVSVIEVLLVRVRVLKCMKERASCGYIQIPLRRARSEQLVSAARRYEMEVLEIGVPSPTSHSAAFVVVQLPSLSPQFRGRPFVEAHSSRQEPRQVVVDVLFVLPRRIRDAVPPSPEGLVPVRGVDGSCGILLAEASQFRPEGSGSEVVIRFSISAGDVPG